MRFGMRYVAIKRGRCLRRDHISLSSKQFLAWSLPSRMSGNAFAAQFALLKH